jgi:hypothetical protein
MKKNLEKPNVFVVDTPYQLLNAVEAVHFFELKNNHLFVVRHDNAGPDRFKPLIKAADWATVRVLCLTLNSKDWVQKAFGEAVNQWYCRCLHFQRMRRLANATRNVKDADKVFLGHYWVEEKPYMRHVANTIKHDTVYLLDDGTDTVDINARRNGIESSQAATPRGAGNGRGRRWKGVETYLRSKYWNWDSTEAPSVTFFTTYDIDVCKRDRLIRNRYKYLRSLAPAVQTHSRDSVIFLGQCVVEDGCMDTSAYLAYLSKVRDYFAGRKFIYVAHPRENALWTARVTEHLRADLWFSSSVIEYDLIVRGFKPGAVAGFATSALISLAQIMDADVEIVCFQIPAEDWMNWREGALGVYDYLKKKARPRVTTVPLSRQGHQSRSSSE